ncbi:hypothetical protein [Streptomyces sp. NPDC001068]|uniref:hypothetical protein n=1 Tax=Streptomyces sp. NPDC001068 TaxID=3364544 RepID=UPI00367611AE
MVNGGGSGFAGLPGGIAVSRPCAYDWPDADGARGGTPHPHLAGSEVYVVTGGRGAALTLPPRYPADPRTYASVTAVPADAAEAERERSSRGRCRTGRTALEQGRFGMCGRLDVYRQGQ